MPSTRSSRTLSTNPAPPTCIQTSSVNVIPDVVVRTRRCTIDVLSTDAAKARLSTFWLETRLLFFFPASAVAVPVRATPAATSSAVAVRNFMGVTSWGGLRVGHPPP